MTPFIHCTKIYFQGSARLAQRILNGVNLKDPLSGLRVVRTGILKGWKPKSKGFDIEAELNHHIKCCGYKTLEIPILGEVVPLDRFKKCS
jgi:hypothetical protein